MAKTLEELREQVGREMGVVLSGEATGGAAGTVVDTEGLAHVTEDDGLNGAFVFIREAGGAAPEGEWRRILDYDGGTQTISVEFNFTAAVGAGDDYEVYRVPLTLDELDEAVNQGIRGAWPEVWNPVMEEWTVGVGGEDEHDVGGEALGGDAEDLVDVWVKDPVGGGLGIGGWQLMPRVMWRYERDAQMVYYERDLFAGVYVRVLMKERYQDLGAGEETTLDEGYLVAAAKGHVYEALAGSVGAGHDAGRFLDLMSHWLGVAGERKKAVGLGLERVPAVMG